MAYNPSKADFVNDVIEYINTLLNYSNGKKQRLKKIYDEMNLIIKDYKYMFKENIIHQNLLNKREEILKFLDQVPQNTKRRITSRL